MNMHAQSLTRSRRALIVSDNRDFVSHLVKAYRRKGFEVACGASNFFSRSASYDLIHHLWPEELTGWRPPSDSLLREVLAHAEWWKQHSVPIISVGNLMPHGYDDDPRFKRLYELLYSHVKGIVHHSRASKSAVEQLFPLTKNLPSVITTMCSYHDLRSRQSLRVATRKRFSIPRQAFVVLLFGSLRLWKEIELFKRAYGAARIVNKIPLIVARYSELHPQGPVKSRVRRYQWRWWLQQTGATVIDRYVPDEEIQSYFEAADAIVIPRIRDLSSGMVGLGMTFGTLIVAPNHGAFPDYLKGTMNLLYESGDSKSLADALETAARMDMAAVRETNMKVASEWTWDGIVDACIDAWRLGSHNGAVLHPALSA